MTEKEIQLIKGLTEAISILLQGHVPESIQCPERVGEELRLLGRSMNTFIADFGQAHDFIHSLARGDLEADPPPRNYISSPYKQLHANLRHLVWQTQQVAKGDLSQQVDFLGNFADAFNSMIMSLREKRALEEALMESHENLALRVKERTAELSAINEQLSREIVERTIAEGKLERALTDLTRINDDLRQFAYVSSHDLKEPLRSLTISVQMLQKLLHIDPGSEEDQWIRWIMDSAARMKALIEDILAFSRLETRLSSNKPNEPINAETALEGAIANLRSDIDRTGAIVTYDRLPSVIADETELTLLFQGMLDNAIKFRRAEPPRIHVAAQITGDECEFSLSDNGLGIKPEHRERIFLVFQRLHAGNEYPGTGIGLAMAKKIVECYGGRIWVQSESGAGSQIYFTLPVR